MSDLILKRKDFGKTPCGNAKMKEFRARKLVLYDASAQICIYDNENNNNINNNNNNNNNNYYYYYYFHHADDTNKADNNYVRIIIF